MSEAEEKSGKVLQWRLECLGHGLVEGLAALLPAPWAYRLGGFLGGLVCGFLPRRQKVILRNLRIALAGEKELPELRVMARETFKRTAANLVSAARTAKLKPGQLAEVIEIENLHLLEKPVSEGTGVVILLSHMGNWEILSRIVHFFPEGTKAGAFYRPLNNPIMNQQVLDRRQADGTRMFSKGDNPLHVAKFLREGGVVGILADQRVGMQGEVTTFFGRVTRASPLPSLLARRSKSVVLALPVVTTGPGKWKATFLPVETPHHTENCMRALETAMKSSPVDVFWLQERWRAFVDSHHTLAAWLGGETRHPAKPVRALLWLPGVDASWLLPDDWQHPDANWELVVNPGQAATGGVTTPARTHTLDTPDDRNALQRILSKIDEADALPLDLVLTVNAPKALVKAAKREGIRLVSLP